MCTAADARRPTIAWLCALVGSTGHPASTASRSSRSSPGCLSPISWPGRLILWPVSHLDAVSGLVSENLYVDVSESAPKLRELIVLSKFQVTAIDPNRQSGSVNRPTKRRAARSAATRAEQRERFFALVTLAWWHHPFPFRTRK